MLSVIFGGKELIDNKNITNNRCNGEWIDILFAAPKEM